jgi:hypothetical protein
MRVSATAVILKSLSSVIFMLQSASRSGSTIIASPVRWQPMM